MFHRHCNARQKQQQATQVYPGIDAGARSTGIVRESSSSGDYPLDLRRRSSTIAANRDNKEASQHRQIRTLKITILLFFLITAAGVGLAFFFYQKDIKLAETQRQQEQFEQDSANVLIAIGASLDATLGAADAFAVDMISHARTTNQSWPFVTMPNFAVKAKKLLSLTDATYLNTYPLVKGDQREAWENYTKNHNGWVEESIQIQNNDVNYHGPQITEEYMKDYAGHYDLIHGYDEYFYEWENNTVGVQHSGPYLPWWQCAPVIPVYPVYNW